jgi:NAD(P)-dependent dehydrogenase (short-subunit alcohol dehydrogenase family)
MRNQTMKNYLIVGASSGIGLAVAQSLVNNENNIFTLSRNKTEPLAELDTKHLTFDIMDSDLADLTNFLPETLHGLVYCPGTINLKPFARLSEADFLNDYHINVLGAVKIIQKALPNLQRGQPASIVLFSTVASKLGMNFHASVSSSKAALEGLAKSLAAEYAKDQIRVNVIAPSITQTPLAQFLLNSDKKIEASIERHPLRKIGDPNDIAQSVSFMLTEQSSWITGQILHVDGGLSSLKVL